jgi:uncharacterized protein YdgA (DUF945 family)
MRKRFTILGSLLLLLALVLGLPYALGLQAERTFGANLERSRQSAGAMVKSSRFHRGWLASTAEVVFMYPGAPIELHTTHRITHGPLAIGRWLEGDAHWAPVQAMVHSQGRLHHANGTVLALPTITAETVIELGGEGETRFSLPAFKSEHHGELQGASGSVRFSADMNQIHAKFVLGRATLRAGALRAGDLESLAFRDGRFEANLTQDEHGVWLGPTELLIDELAIAPVLQLRGLRLTSTTLARGAEIDVVTTQSVKLLQFAGNALGELSMAVDVRRLNARALGQYERELSALYQNSPPAEQLSLMVMGKTINLLAALSKATPELEVREFRLRSAQGELKGRAKLVLDGSQFDVSQNPMLLLVALKGEAELTVPREMMKGFFASRIAADVEALKQRGALASTSAEQLDGVAMDRIVDQALAMYVAEHQLGRHFQPAGSDFKITAAIRRGQVFLNDQLWQGGLAALQ